MKYILIFLSLFMSAEAFAQLVNVDKAQTLSNKTLLNSPSVAVGTNQANATLHVRGTFQLDSTSAQNAEWQMFDSTGNKWIDFKLQTLNTNIVFLQPTEPRNGWGYYTLSSATNLTLSFVSMVYEFALSDETTAITVGTAKLTWRAPHAMTITDVRASVATASSSGIPTVNIKESGTTIFSTKLTIDANEKTSTTAATAYVLSDTSIADDAEITFDIDVAGTGAAGLKVKIYYTR